MALVAAGFVLAACGGDHRLMNLRNDGKPDEFAILPTKPLQAPPDYAALPPPTPGEGNRTDPTPVADAVAALGGQPAALARAPSGADAALIGHAGRFGTDPAIRTWLAQADADFRASKNPRLLERLFAVSVYLKVYQPMALDKYAELARLRRAGVKTPAAPPEGVEIPPRPIHR